MLHAISSDSETPVPDPSRFEHFSSQVTAGLWECDLATEKLHWSEGVYRLFGVPLGTPLDRCDTVGCYDQDSRIALEVLRTAAIRDKISFSLDARITALDGVERWIRITAHVECEDGKATRLFGSKHDVSEERALWGERVARPPSVDFALRA